MAWKKVRDLQVSTQVLRTVPIMPTNIVHIAIQYHPTAFGCIVFCDYREEKLDENSDMGKKAAEQNRERMKRGIIPEKDSKRKDPMSTLVRYTRSNLYQPCSTVSVPESMQYEIPSRLSKAFNLTL